MGKINEIRLSGTTYTIEDPNAIHSSEGYWTSGQTEDAITASTAALAEAVAEELSGKTDVNTFTGYTASTQTTLSGFADAVGYDSNSKAVKFYNGGTGGTEVYSFDASPFLIDGMVQNVEIKNVTISGESVTCLVISFNTDAGKQDINIPISQIFDASNYYTTAQTDSAIAAATSGKVDTSTYTAYTAATDTALSGKQATLVSGTNIKTINNESIIGSGNIEIQGGGMTATVSGTTLIFE